MFGEGSGVSCHNAESSNGSALQLTMQNCIGDNKTPLKQNFMFEKRNCVLNTEASIASAESLASGRILDALYRPTDQVKERKHYLRKSIARFFMRIVNLYPHYKTELLED